MIVGAVKDMSNRASPLCLVWALFDIRNVDTVLINIPCKYKKNSNPTNIVDLFEPNLDKNDTCIWEQAFGKNKTVCIGHRGEKDFLCIAEG